MDGATTTEALTPETAVRMLRASLVEPPRSFPVAWYAGRDGRILSAEEYDPPTFINELRAMVLTPRPKGEGPALLPAQVQPDSLRRPRSVVVAPTLAILDYDAGALTLDEARAMMRGWGSDQERPAGVWFPSPSAEGGGGARRWRCLLPLAPGTEPATLVAGAETLARVMGAALGVTFDASTLRPESLTYINPIPGVHRSRDDVTVVSGLAVDVGALMVRAAALGIVTARSVGASRDAYRAHVRDGASVVALLTAAGLLRGAPDARGWQPFECPRAEWHGSKAARRDTSTAVNVHTGACMCSHEHSRAPPSERGVARVRRVLEWLAATRPELAPAVALTRDVSGLIDRARELFARPADGATPRRVSLAAVGDTITEALSYSARERVPVLCTPPPGSGKSHAVGAALAALCSDVEYEPRDDAQTPLACAVVIVRDRARIAELAAVILRAGLGVRVHTPVHDVLARPGHPEDASARRECAYHIDARRLYQRGASVRASLCPAVQVQGPVPRVAPCEHIDGCAARDPWVAWSLREGVAVQALDAMTPGERWVAITTAASAYSAGKIARQNAPVIVDESDVILTPGSATLDGQALDGALRWARMLAPARVRKQPTGAPRILGVALAAAARDAGVNELAALDGEARAAWCVAKIAESLNTGARRHDVAVWCGVVDDGDPVQLARLAFVAWCGRSTRHAITHGDAPDGATPSSRESEAFNALWRWVRGAHAEHDPEAGALSLAWPSDAAELARARGDMGVMCLDATGTPSLVRAALGAVHHVPVTVAEGADVRRVCVATRRAGRRALTPHGGVQWDAAGPALRGALGALRAARRDGFGRGPVVVFSALSLSLACEALATGVDVRALPRAATLPNERRDRVAVAVSCAPPEAVTAVRELAGLGVTWCHYQGRDARGANHLQGAAAVITLGDARPELRATRTMLRALYREAPTPELARETGDRIAAAEAAQCHGRLRAVRREGERLCMVHVGHPACAPIDWRGVDGVQTVSLPLARRWGEAPPVAIVPPTAEGLAVDAVTEALSDETAAVSEHAHPAVRACAALGYGIRGVAEATGRDRATVRAWWHGRSQPRRAGDVRVLDALASGEGAPALRMMLRKQLAGRGWDALWRGVRGVPGLRGMLDREGLTPNEGALRVWCETGQPVPDAATLGALARVRPSLMSLYPPVVRALPPGATTRDRWMFEG